eukprot:SAG22_NODE_231_length_14551_cov_22.298090_1_plen_197_part_10
MLDALRGAPGGEARCTAEDDHIAAVGREVPARATSSCPALLAEPAWAAWCVVRDFLDTSSPCVLPPDWRPGERRRDGSGDTCDASSAGVAAAGAAAGDVVCPAAPLSCQEAHSCCGGAYDSCTCEAPYCFVPAGIFAAASGGPCAEGGVITPGGKCTPRCAAGYTPTVGGGALGCHPLNGTLVGGAGNRLPQRCCPP